MELEELEEAEELAIVDDELEEVELATELVELELEVVLIVLLLGKVAI